MTEQELRFKLHRFYEEFRANIESESIHTTLFDMYMISFINEAPEYVCKSEGSQNHNQSHELPQRP